MVAYSYDVDDDDDEEFSDQCCVQLALYITGIISMGWFPFAFLTDNNYRWITCPVFRVGFEPVTFQLHGKNPTITLPCPSYEFQEHLSCNSFHELTAFHNLMYTLYYIYKYVHPSAVMKIAVWSDPWVSVQEKNQKWKNDPLVQLEARKLD